MTRSGKIKLRMSIIIVAFSLLVVVRPAGAGSLNLGEVYSSLDGKRTIEVISKEELEITKGGDILLAQYNFRGDKLRVVYSALGTKMVEYYELTHDGLKDKDGNILYSKEGLATRKELYKFFDVFKAAAMERDIEKIRNLTHPSFLSSVNKDYYQRIIKVYFDFYNEYIEFDEVRIEDVSDKKILNLEKGWEHLVIPEKIIRVPRKRGGEGAGDAIEVVLHKGEWKWVGPSPKNYENFWKYLRREGNTFAIAVVKAGHKAAMAYFADFPKGKIDMTKLVQSGFVKSKDVEMSVSGNQSDLKITASHVDGDKVYIINAQGEITAESK